MTRCIRTNSVFLPCEDEGKKYKPIILSAVPSYSPKVKIHDWQLHSLVEPRDNKTGNFRYSTYKRLGMDDEPTGISETRAMTEQIHTKGNYIEEYRYRSLLNFYSFPLTETDEHNKALKLTDLALPKPTEPTDYRTTLKNDYPSHYPIISPRSRSSPIPEIPWLLYRRTLSYNSQDLERRPGITKFMDDNMEIHGNRAAALKKARFVSYDPMLQKYTDTRRYDEAIMKKPSINCTG